MDSDRRKVNVRGYRLTRDGDVRSRVGGKRHEERKKKKKRRAFPSLGDKVENQMFSSFYEYSFQLKII